MPLVSAAVLSYAAGLLTGFGGATLWTGAAALLVAVHAGRKTLDRTALLALATAGFLAAHTDMAMRSRCAGREAGGHAWLVTLAADAAPGTFVRAASDCGTTVMLAVTEGRGAAGARVTVSGEAVQSRDALMISRAQLRVVEPPALLARWRSTIGRGIDLRFGADAPLVRALLIADTRDLSPTVRDRFAAAGLSHMLSVSGLHVGLIAVAVALLAQLCGVSRRPADTIVVAVTFAYVVLIGAPLPAVRAGVMLAAASLSRSVQRPTSPWAVLAVGAAPPLMHARAVLDVGYQLSVVGMAALIASAAICRRWSWLAGRGWQRAVSRALVASTVATALTAPLVAATFGRISIVAPISNLAAVPVMGALQPMLFLAAAALPFAGAATFIAGACHPLLAAIDHIASVAAALPGASLPVLADSTSIALACAAGTGVVVAAVSRFPSRWVLASVGCIALIAWRPLLPSRGGFTELHMIDVGQGDAIALRTRAGRWVLFDAGRDWRGGDEGRRDVIPYLASRGGPLVAFVLSHPHSDHVGGAASTLHALKPAWYYDPAYAGTTAPYLASLEEARRVRARWRRVRPGDSLVVDEATITFLAPDSAWAEAQRDPNLASSVARIRIGQVTMLLTGDAEADEEKWLLAHEAGVLHSDVLKVAHHGSRTSSTPAFLDAVRPRVALVSVGAGNTYGHPSAAVMAELAARGVLTLRTDRDGTIVVRTDGRSLEAIVDGELVTVKPLP